jgi:hypothetical protein
MNVIRQAFFENIKKRKHKCNVILLPNFYSYRTSENILLSNKINKLYLLYEHTHTHIYTRILNPIKHLKI